MQYNALCECRIPTITNEEKSCGKCGGFDTFEHTFKNPRPYNKINEAKEHNKINSW